MDYLIYIILGIIQGFTEPIPVSSSGHIFLFKNMFNSKLSGNDSQEQMLNIDDGNNVDFPDDMIIDPEDSVVVGKQWSALIR